MSVDGIGNGGGGGGGGGGGSDGRWADGIRSIHTSMVSRPRASVVHNR